METGLNELKLKYRREVEEKLLFIFEMVESTIRFAEVKNVRLLAFNATILLLGVFFIKGHWEEKIRLCVFIYVASLNFLSLLTCLFSMGSQLRHKERELSLKPSDNFMFFGTLAGYKPESLLEEIKIRYGLTDYNAKYGLDLCRQIVIVSQIATRKFQLFNVGLVLTLCGICSPLILPIYFLFFNPNR